MEEAKTNEPHTSDKKEDVNGPEIPGKSDKKDEAIEVTKTNDHHSDKKEEEVKGPEIRGESDKKDEGMEVDEEAKSDKKEQHSDKKEEEVKGSENQSASDKKDDGMEEAKTNDHHSDKKEDEVKGPEIRGESDKKDEGMEVDEEAKSDEKEQHSDKKEDEVTRPEIQGESDKKDEGMEVEETKSDEQLSDNDKKEDDATGSEIQGESDKKNEGMEEAKTNEQPSDKKEGEVTGPEIQGKTKSDKKDEDIMEVDLEVQSENKEEKLTEEKGKEAEGEGQSSQKDEANKETEGKEPGTSERKDDGNLNPGNEEEEEDDDDEPPPKIFLRNLAEIMEPDSDDDDVTCLTEETPTFYQVDDQNRMIPVNGANVSNNNNNVSNNNNNVSNNNNNVSNNNKNFSNNNNPSQNKVPPTTASAILTQTKLSSKATYDTESADVEMSCHADPNYKTNVNTSDRRIPLISKKLLGWFKKRKAHPPQKNPMPPNQSQPPTLLPISVTPTHPPETQQLIRISPASTVSNSPVTINLPGTPVHGLPVTAINWSPQHIRSPSVTASGPPQFVTSVTAGSPLITQVRSTRPNANANVVSGPHQLINISSKTAPGGKIIFDPNTGLILYPANTIIQQQPNNVGQQPQLLPQGIRLQNGMVIRPETVSYSPRSGVEINNTFAPTHAQIANRMNLQVQQPIIMQQRSPAPVRNNFVTPRAPIVTPRTSVPAFLPQRPLANIRPAPSPPPFRVRSVANVRMSPVAPVPVQQQLSTYQVHQPPPPPVQAPPMRQVAPSVRQYGNPRMSRMPFPVPRQSVPSPPDHPDIRHSVPRLKHQLQPQPKVPRLNGFTEVFNILPDGEPRGVIEKNITAGNQKPMPGTVVDADSDLQNKTFPSLVVHVKTCLSSKPSRQMMAQKRGELDAEVKGVLVHPPARFTEWLMSRQLIKSKDINCLDHARTIAHLGQYIDTNREPFSGGYVWIPVCCPRKYTSVFNGSIFEGSKYPPGTLLKLIYHWSVQTPASNVLQWVKVSSSFLKNFFTMIRAVCITWMHERCHPMGGEMRYVEIGVITLGSSAETSRGVKNVNVEILGVFDPSTKIVRMKVINSLQGQLFKDRNRGQKPDAYEQGARAFQILWPLTHWVDKRSILLVDGIIDKALFHELGFRNVQQCGPEAKTSTNNINIMNYLRNLVPKMFSSTLSVLSKSIVQQFLDELSWREVYAPNVKECYINVLKQLGDMTSWDLGTETLISRLNKVNQNPFLDWSFTKQARRCPMNTIPMALRNEPGIQECIRHVMKDDFTPKLMIPKLPPPPPVRMSAPSQLPPASRSFPHNLVPRKKTTGVPLTPLPSRPSETTRKRKATTETAETNLMYYKNHYAQSVKQHPIQFHYYGEITPLIDKKDHIQTVFPSNLKCPLCVRIFTSANDIVRHMYLHVSVSVRNSENLICSICLKELPTGVTMQHHIAMFHKMTDFQHACRICEERFRGEQEFVFHMWDLHTKNEAPYRCSICKFGTSFHYRLIDHFHEEHGGEGNVMCPFCLKSLPALSQTNLKLIISHLQSHNSRRAKKCARCALSFICEADLDTHLRNHLSQKSEPRWVEYTLCEGEDVVLMPFPAYSKRPLMVNPIQQPLSAPPPKKQKVNNTTSKKKGEAKSTLNASFAVPIDTNEKYGGVRYKINVPPVQGKKTTCLECKQEIGSSDHFIGRLSCTKCRYVTACQMAMDLHHKANHLPESKRVVPGLPSRKIKRLGVSLQCKCGFATANPYKLATHLVECEKLTCKPKPGKILEQPKSTKDNTTTDQGPPKLPKEPVPTTISTSNSESSQNEPSIANSLGILNNAPVTTFDDMLSLDESMGCAFGTLALPSLLSPTAPLLDSSLNIPSFTTSSSTVQPSVQSTPSTAISNNDTSATNSWDPDTWDLPSMPGLIAK